MSKRLVLWVAGVLAVLLVAVVVVGVVLINTMNAQAERQAWNDCLARYGYAVDEPAPPGADDDYLEGLSDAAAACAD
jgi:hypothetical protein